MRTESQGESTQLVRALGLKDASLLVIGAVIGSGIFLTPSVIARHTQNIEGLLLVWVMGGILSFCGALSFAELGSMFPRAGGVYAFLDEAYGSLPAFLYGWCTFFVMIPGSIATLGTAFAIYLTYLTPLSMWVAKSAALLIILALTIVNCLGIRAGAMVQNLVTVVKISSLVAIAVVLFLFSRTGPAEILSQPSSQPLVWSSVGIAMIAVLWSYEGWHLLTFTAGEVKDPRRNLTGGLLLGTLVIIVLYLVVNLAYLSILPLGELTVSSQVASDAMEKAIGPIGGTLVAIAILISIGGAMNSNVLTGPRVFYAMAEDGLFFKTVGYIHPSFHVPTVAIVLTGFVAAVLTMVGSFERLFSYVIFVAWIFYALCAASVIYLRRRRPELDRPYKTWGYPWVPLLFVVAASAIVVNTMVNDFWNSFWGLLVVSTGIPAYFYWHRKRSRLVHKFDRVPRLRAEADKAAEPPLRD